MAWLTTAAFIVLAVLIAVTLAYQVVSVLQRLLAVPTTATLALAAVLLYLAFKRR